MCSCMLADLICLVVLASLGAVNISKVFCISFFFCYFHLFFKNLFSFWGSLPSLYLAKWMWPFSWELLHHLFRSSPGPHASSDWPFTPTGPPLSLKHMQDCPISMNTKEMYVSDNPVLAFVEWTFWGEKKKRENKLKTKKQENATECQ